MSVFPQWRAPFLLHLIIFVLLYILSFARFQVAPSRLDNQAISHTVSAQPTLCGQSVRLVPRGCYVPSSLQPPVPPALPNFRPPSSPPSIPPSQICWPLTWSDTFLWELWNHIPMDNMNKTLAIHSLLTLSLCYLPGVLAAWLQLGRGTKYSRFPRWLDSWMRMRKQLVNIWQCPASLKPATRGS